MKNVTVTVSTNETTNEIFMLYVLLHYDAVFIPSTKLTELL